MSIYLFAIVVLIINIPFGYWRANIRRFSFQFFLAIHIPVALIILFRFAAGTGFEIVTLPFTVPAFIIGQYTGSKIYFYRKLRDLVPLSSCLVMDMIRVKSNSEK